MKIRPEGYEMCAMPVYFKIIIKDINQELSNFACALRSIVFTGVPERISKYSKLNVEV